MFMIANPRKFLKDVDEKCFLMCLVNTNLLLHTNQASIVSSLLWYYNWTFMEDMAKVLLTLRGI